MRAGSGDSRMKRENLWFHASMWTHTHFPVSYTHLDGLNSRTKRRQEDLNREFPDAVSKITLLVAAGKMCIRDRQCTADINYETRKMYMDSLEKEDISEKYKAELLSLSLIHILHREKNWQADIKQKQSCMKHCYFFWYGIPYLLLFFRWYGQKYLFLIAWYSLIQSQLSHRPLPVCLLYTSRCV